MADTSDNILSGLWQKWFGKSDKPDPPPDPNTLSGKFFYAMSGLTPDAIEADKTARAANADKPNTWDSASLPQKIFAPITTMSQKEGDQYTGMLGENLGKMMLYRTPYLGEAAALNDLRVSAPSAYNNAQQGNYGQAALDTANTALSAAGGPLSLWGRASKLATARDPNAVSMFFPAEKNSATALGDTMRKQGMPPEEVYKRTGLIYGADGVAKTEVPAFNAKLTLDPKVNTIGSSTKLSDILDWPEGYSHNPELKNVTVNFNDATQRNGKIPYHTVDAENNTLNMSLGGDAALDKVTNDYHKQAIIGKLQQLIDAKGENATLLAGGVAHAYSKATNYIDNAMDAAKRALETASAQDKPAISAYIANLEANSQPVRDLHAPMLAARQTPNAPIWIENIGRPLGTDTRVRKADVDTILANKLYKASAGVTSGISRYRDTIGDYSAFPLDQTQPLPNMSKVFNPGGTPINEQIAIPSDTSNILGFIKNWYETGGGVEHKLGK